MEPDTDCWMVVHFGLMNGTALALQWSGLLSNEVLSFGHDLAKHDMLDSQWPPHGEDAPRDGLWLWQGSVDWTSVEEDGSHSPLVYTGTWSRLTVEQLAWLSDGRCVA